MEDSSPPLHPQLLPARDLLDNSSVISLFYVVVSCLCSEEAVGLVLFTVASTNMRGVASLDILLNCMAARFQVLCISWRICVHICIVPDEILYNCSTNIPEVYNYFYADISKTERAAVACPLFGGVADSFSCWLAAWS